MPESADSADSFDTNSMQTKRKPSMSLASAKKPMKKKATQE